MLFLFIRFIYGFVFLVHENIILQQKGEDEEKNDAHISFYFRRSNRTTMLAKNRFYHANGVTKCCLSFVKVFSSFCIVFDFVLIYLRYIV